MLLAPTFTLAEANALVPYIADEVARLRGAIMRARELDAHEAAPEPARAANGDGPAPVTAHVDPQRAAIDADVEAAVAALSRIGASVRLDPPGVDVAGMREGERVRLHWLEGADEFRLWRDARGRLHAIDNAADFGDALVH